MEMSHVHDSFSLLVFAAVNKSPDVFGAVVSGIEKDRTPQEVRNSSDLEFIRHIFEGGMCPCGNINLTVNEHVNPNLICYNTSYWG